MANKRRLTRAERRNRRAAERAAWPEARAYGVEVSDASAQSWVSRVVFFAESRAQAEERLAASRLRRGGVAACSDLDPAEIPHAVWAMAERKPDSYYRSRLDDGGWTSWEELLPTYVHPTDARGARDASVRGPAGEAREGE